MTWRAASTRLLDLHCTSDCETCGIKYTTSVSTYMFKLCVICNVTKMSMHVLFPSNYFASGRGAKYCDPRVSVCLSARISQNIHVQIFSYRWLLLSAVTVQLLLCWLHLGKHKVKICHLSSFSELNGACGIFYLTLLGRVVHTIRDSPGGSMRRGQHTFPSITRTDIPV